MAGNKRARQRENRQARLAAAAAARRSEMRKRRAVTLGLLTGVVLIALFFLTRNNDDATDVAAGSTTTSATKACVAVTDPLPAGAPEVPVVVGPAPTSLSTRDLVVGTGATVAAGAEVTVNYIGATCTTGKIFDSSYSRGAPATFSLSQVIQGWQQGIPGMQVGGRRLLGIPSSHAYGQAGSGELIGANEPLWFVVELLGTTAP